MRRILLLTLHWTVIITLVIQCLYAGFQVFFVMVPEGHSGPLWGAAMRIDPDLMLARRLYALEAWLAFVGLAIYLGITVIRPGLRRGTED